jgi:hypothetical protein
MGRRDGGVPIIAGLRKKSRIRLKGFIRSTFQDLRLALRGSSFPFVRACRSRQRDSTVDDPQIGQSLLKFLHPDVGDPSAIEVEVRKVFQALEMRQTDV